MEDTTNTLQPKENENPEAVEETLEELGQKRDFQIKQKKRFFNKIKFLAIILGITGLGLFVTYVIYERQRTTAPVTPVIINDDEPQEPQEPASTWELHRDDNLKVFVKIPPEAKVFTYDNPMKLEVVYSASETDFSKVTEQNLTNGYIFKITPLSLGTRDLNKIAEIKRESYKIQCPPTATISTASKSLLDSVDALYFEVSNCNVEYVVSYVPKFGIYYEVAQIYRGDIGVDQQYRSKTQELVNALRFFPEDSPKPYEPFVTYFNEALNFSLKYPETMDTQCCDLLGPAVPTGQTGKNDKKLLVTAYLPTFKDKNNFDGFALYLHEQDPRSKTTFTSYVEEQKRILAEEYKVVTGNEPQRSEEQIQVGNLTGTALHGYHWQGTDIIFVDVSSRSRIGFLTIVVKNINGEEFKRVMDDTLKSFELYKL